MNNVECTPNFDRSSINKKTTCKLFTQFYHYYAVEIFVEVTSSTSSTTTDASTVDILDVSLAVIFGVIVLLTAAALIGLLVKKLCWKRKRGRSMS